MRILYSLYEFSPKVGFGDVGSMYSLILECLMPKKAATFSVSRKSDDLIVVFPLPPRL